MMQSQRSRQILAGVVVSVVTLALIGTVLVAMTPVGCGPANKLGLKAISNRCVKSQSAAAAGTPTPSPYYSSPPPYVPPASGPYAPPASGPYAPPASGPFPPDGGPASAAYQPFNPPASSTGGTAVPGLALTCRLPIYVGPPGSGGFITFPSGDFIADPRSSVTIPSPSPGESPAPPPVGPGGYGPGYTGLSYDRAHSRWLPVPYAWVSSDGNRYVHPSKDSIYVENVVTGATIELGQGQAWAVVGVWDQGVYATIVSQAGLWLLPYSGPAKQITTTGFWQVASSGAAYGTLTSAVPQGVANSIIRVDTKTGAITDWFSRQGAQTFVSGLDSHGYPLLSVNYFVQGQGNEIWSTSGPGTAVPVFGSNQGLNVSGPPVADSHGVWFPLYYNPPYGQSAQGMALYVAGSGLYWMSSVGAQLAGGCS